MTRYVGSKCFLGLNRSLNKKIPFAHRLATKAKGITHQTSKGDLIIMLQSVVSARKISRKKSSRQSTPTTGAAAEVVRSQARITCDRIVVKHTHQSVDFLKVSFWLQWEDTTFLETLDWLKKRLQSTEDDEVCVFKDCGLDWNLMRTGTQKFNYRLKAGDVTLLFNRRAHYGNIPNFRIEVGSLTSQTSLYQTINNIKHWMERKHAIFMKEQVSEVHLAVDFIGLDIKTLDIANQDRWIHRSHIFDPHYKHRKLTGVSIGKGDIMLRVYDKVAELKGSEHKQEVFTDLWQVSSYDEYPVTRVEYQLRRPVLKEFQHLEFCNGVHTVKNFLFAIKSLWFYCTSDWAAFNKTIVDRKNKNQSKAKCSEFWKIVRSVPWTGLHEMRREKPVKHKNIEALRKQARGIFMSIAAFFISNPDDINKIVKQSQALLEQDLRELYKEESKFIRKMTQKRNEVLLDTVPF